MTEQEYYEVPRTRLAAIWEKITRFLGNVWRNLITTAFMFATFYFVYVAIWNTQSNGIELLLILTLVAYFPFTYMAYWAVRTPIRRKRLEEELALLGYPKDEATRLYEQVHDQSSYALFITLTMLTTFFGAAIFFWGLPTATIDAATIQAIRYGFLGSYLFSAFLVYRRFSTNDLHPTVFLYCAFTMVAGIVFNYVAVEALTNITNSNNVEATGVGAGLLAIVAFALGYFPYLAVRWFNRLAFTSLGVNQRRTDLLPLSLIDGISEWHETRLRDTGIDDIQNLASAEIRDLLANTAFNVQEIIEWIDQAILYLYLEPSEIESFRRAKIRTTSDFSFIWENCEDDPQKRDEVILNLQSTAERLKVLYSSISEGPNVHRVRNYWKRAKARVDTIVNLAGVQSQLDQLEHVAERLDYTVYNSQSHNTLLADLAKEFAGLLSTLWHNPTDKDNLNLGKLYMSLEEYDKAVAQFDEVIRKIKQEQITDPIHFAAFRSRIYANINTHDKDTVIKECDNLISITSNTLPLLVDAYLVKGNVYEHFKDYDNALITFAKAIECNSQSADSYNAFAWFIVNAQPTLSDKLPAAIEAAAKAVQLTTGKANYPNCLDTLAYAQIISAGQAEPVNPTLYESAFGNLQEALKYPQLIDELGYYFIRDHLYYIANHWAGIRDARTPQALEHEEDALLAIVTIPTLDSYERNEVTLRLKALRQVMVTFNASGQANGIVPHEAEQPPTPNVNTPQ